MRTQTLCIIKPDAIAAHHCGPIITRLEESSLQVIAAQMLRLTRSQASSFYSIHSDKPFFFDLISFMSSGPLLALVLSAPDAVNRHRTLMGNTDPAKATPHTIRADFGQSIERNAIHGSDSPETAQREVSFFFPAHQIFSDL